VAASVGINIEDFEKLPDALARNKELVNGELVDVSGNLPRHNKLRDRLVALLLLYVEERNLGLLISEQEFDFDGNAHGPDVALINPADVPLMAEERRVQPIVPSLAIEIVSRNDTFEMLMEKAARYRTCGTREVWVLAPKTRQAFVLSEERQAILNDTQPFESPQLPGFSVRLGELFDRCRVVS
jgi:Uma2 family endonuclease